MFNPRMYVQSQNVCSIQKLMLKPKKHKSDETVHILFKSKIQLIKMISNIHIKGKRGSCIITRVAFINYFSGILSYLEF